MTDAAPASGEPLLEFLAVMRRLRTDCAWKREQTHRSLARYLLEEAHETLEAIDSGDADHLCEELGDLLLQVYFHAVLAEEAGDFTIDDVARGITEKMYRRNPHVFGPAARGALDGPGPAGPGPDPDGPGPDAAAVNDAWQAIKAQEKSRGSVTDGLPPTLPALLLADKVLDRLARSGAAAVAPAPAASTASTPGEPTPVDTVIGDRLLAVVADAREAGVDPEQALRDAVRRLTSPAGPAPAVE